MIKKTIPLLPHIFLYGTTVGQPTLPTFKLQGIDDNFYENKDFNKNGNLGIVFLSNHCRISQKFQDHLVRLSKRCKTRKMTFLQCAEPRAAVLQTNKVTLKSAIVLKR